MSPKKLPLPTSELTSILKSIDTCVDKRLDISRKDAIDGKDGVNHKVCKRLLEDLRSSLSNKIQKITTPTSIAMPSSEALLDGEATERIAALTNELNVVSKSIKSLRKEVMKRLETVESNEFKVRGEVGNSDASLSLSLNTSTSSDDSEYTELDEASIATMKNTLDKLTSELLTLAGSLPGKLEGFSRTVDAVTGSSGSNGGEGKSEVERAITERVEIASSASSASSVASSAASSSRSSNGDEDRENVNTNINVNKGKSPGKSKTPTKDKVKEQPKLVEDVFAALMDR